MKLLILLSLTVPLAACGPTIYQRPNTTNYQFASDQADCQDYVGALPKSVSSGGNHVLGFTPPEAQMRTCMKAKGYTLRDP